MKIKPSQLGWLGFFGFSLLNLVKFIEIPLESLDAATEPLQMYVIRFLALFCNGLPLSSFPYPWLFLGLFFVGSGILSSDSKEYSALSRPALIGCFIATLFFWVFLLRYAPEYAASNRSSLLLNTLLFWAVNLGIYWLFAFFQKRRAKKRQMEINKHALAKGSILSVCPHCQREYWSNPKYCIYCEKTIRS